MTRKGSEDRVCRLTHKPYKVSAEEREALEYFGLPVPDVCPEERLRSRMAFHGERRYFWRRCDATGARIPSIYAAYAPFPVYSASVWNSDSWDPLSFGRSFDFQKAFFEQLAELWRVVPRPSASVADSRECRAAQNARRCERCVLVSSAIDTIDSCYCSDITRCSGCCDCDFVTDCTRCFECLNCHGCASVRWGEHCFDVQESSFVANCRSCRHCLFCANLEHREYCLFNEQLTADEYQQKLREWDFGHRTVVEKAREQFGEFLKSCPVPHLIVESEASENCEGLEGNFLVRVRAAMDAFYCSDGEGLLHCDRLAGARKCLEGYGFGDRISDSAQFVSCGSNAVNLVNCLECHNDVEDLTYCSHCERSRHLFGCIGVRGREYCLFNRQYSAREYETLRKTIEEALRQRSVFGRFFPMGFSGVAYNVSTAGSLMPLNRAQAAVLQLAWDEEEDKIKTTRLAGIDGSQSEVLSDTPESIYGDDGEAIESKVFLCEMTGQPFQILKSEWAFYHEMLVCPPSRAYDQRRHERLQRFGPRRMITRQSSFSKNEMVTSFPADWRQPVYRRDEWFREAVNRQQERS